MLPSRNGTAAVPMTSQELQLSAQRLHQRGLMSIQLNTERGSRGLILPLGTTGRYNRLGKGSPCLQWCGYY